MKKQFLKTLKEYETLLTKNEAEFLLNISKKIPEQGVIVEIGTYKGGSAFLLAKGSMKNKKGKVYTIDSNPNNLKSIIKNIKKAKLENWITPITKTSEQAAKQWRKPISFLFIDGKHNYPFVKLDFLLWEKHLIKGGIIAFHDSRDSKEKELFNNLEHAYYEGPRIVVKESILNSNRFKNIGFIDTITYAQKVRNKNILESVQYRLKTILEKIEKTIGKIGFLKRFSQKLYFKLKKFKDRKIRE